LNVGMIDLWERLHTYFNTTGNEIRPEIELANLTSRSLEYLLYFLLNESRGLETDIAIRKPFKRVRISSQEHVIKLLATGKLIGELFLSLRMDFVDLPEMGFFIDGPDYLSVQYLMGPEWTPIRLITLFEFLRMVKILEPGAYIGLGADSFSWEHRKHFELTLQEYLNEQIPPR
jgi:hypothetical protein